MSIVKQVLHTTCINHSRHLIPDEIHHQFSLREKVVGYRGVQAWLSIALFRKDSLVLLCAQYMFLDDNQYCELDNM